jgi:hypothetical protein
MWLETTSWKHPVQVNKVMCVCTVTAHVREVQSHCLGWTSWTERAKSWWQGCQHQTLCWHMCWQLTSSGQGKLSKDWWLILKVVCDLMILSYQYRPWMLIVAFPFCRHVLLNGRELHLNPDGSLPPFEPKYLNISKDLLMPEFSMAFWVIQDVHAVVCEGQWIWNMCHCEQ